MLDARIADGATAASEVVARHFEAAGLTQRGRHPLPAGRPLAAERSGHREAIAFLRQGIALARELADVTEGRELEVEMQLALGSSIATRSYSDPELAVAYDRARELCELLGNDQRVGQTLGGLSVFYINQGEIALGAELAERVLAIAEAYEDDLLEVLGRVQLGPGPQLPGTRRTSRWSWPPGPWPSTTPSATGAGHRFGTDQGVAAHVFAGWEHLLLGHLDRGLGHARRRRSTWPTTLGQPFNRVYALAFLATGHWERGESAETLHFAGTGPLPGRGAGVRLLGRDQRGVGGGRAGHRRDGDRRHWTGRHPGRARWPAETGNRGGSTNVLARVAEAAHAAGEPDDHPGRPGHGAVRLGRDRSAVVGPGPAPACGPSCLRRGRPRHAGDLVDPDHPWARAEAAWLTALELADRFGLSRSTGSGRPPATPGSSSAP